MTPKNSAVYVASRKRVALVTSGYFTAGGVQSVARWLKTQLIEEGYLVTVFDVDASRNSPLSRRLLSPKTWFRAPSVSPSPADPAVYSVGTSLAEFEPLRYLPQPRLTQELDKFDVVQVVCGGPALSLKTSRTRTPVVVQMATLVKWEREARLSSLPRLRSLYETAIVRLVSAIEPIALRHARAILVENARILDSLEEMQVANVRFAPPGVDVSRFAFTSSRGTTGPLLYLGRLGDPRKGLDRLIHAYSTAKDIDPTIPDLMLCGRGTLDERARTELQRSRWASAITVRMDLNSEDLSDALSRASIFVQASHEEGLGVALLEGMASGLPAIATATAGTEETVLHGKNGLLLPQSGFDGNALAKSINQIRSDYLRFSDHARDFVVENFSNKVAIGRFLDCYQDLR